MNEDFKIQGNQIFSLASGDLVATVDPEGNVKMQPGKNAMTPKVKAFYEAMKHNMPETPAAPEMVENPQFEAALNDAEEVNTHKLAEDMPEVRLAFGDAPRTGGTSAPARAHAPETPVDPRSKSVWDIPDSELPPFDPALGVSTPEFKTFVRKHKFSKEQSAELVKRLERKK